MQLWAAMGHHSSLLLLFSSVAADSLAMGPQRRPLDLFPRVCSSGEPALMPPWGFPEQTTCLSRACCSSDFTQGMRKQTLDTATLSLNILSGNHFRLTEKLQEQYEDYLYTIKPDSPIDSICSLCFIICAPSFFPSSLPPFSSSLPSSLPSFLHLSIYPSIYHWFS